MPARYNTRTIVDQGSRTRQWPTIVAIACVSGLMLAGVYGLLRLVPASWQQSLETCEQSEIVPRLHRLIDMQPDGLLRLTDTLKSEREDLALGAAQVLNVHLARWERLPTHIGRAKAKLVAAEIAKHVSELSPQVKLEAARLVKRILRWPSDPGATDRAILVSHCDTVLQAVDEETGVTQAALYVTSENEPSRSILTSSERVLHITPSSGLPVDLPHRDADVEPIEAPPPTIASPFKSAPTANPDTRRDDTTAAEPPRLMPTPNEGVDNFRVSPQPMPLVSTEMTPAPNRPARLPVDSELLSRLWEQPQSLSSFELLRLAQSDDGETSRRAWKELHAREIPPKFLELGLHLTNPDPMIRRQWSQRLPSLPGIDARPWLLALSEDDDAEVRMNALVLMATMGDPRLLRRIEQIARDDREPQIQDQARRILEGQERRR